MTPETRLACWSVGLTVLGLALILAAVITAGYDHKGDK